MQGDYKSKLILISCTIIFILSLLVCHKNDDSKIIIKREAFQKALDGKQIDLYTLTNVNGLEVKITNYGGKIVSLNVPDRNGKLGDIVLGYKSIDEYLTGNQSFGAVIGRYANRIAKGKFDLNGVTYALAQNNGENHLHGGIKGFRSVVWDVNQIDDKTLELKYLSKDGEEGYPGNLDVQIVYFLTDENEFRIEYFATTDQPTVINLTSHSFFNLKSEGQGDILNHELMIDADYFTPVDEAMIPTGVIKSVKDTPLDFTQPEKIAARINNDCKQLKFGNGYDHNFVLNKTDAELSLAAQVYEAETGRIMEIYTTEPGIQFYSGNFLSGKDVGKTGTAYHFRSAFCLEPQHFPDSPNQPNFPSTILNPGEEYKSVTVYKFSVR